MKSFVLALLCCGLISADLCNIQIFITDDPNQQVNFNQNNEMVKSLHTDKYYHVYCLTNEKVRSRNFISLFRSNQSQDLDSKLNHKYQISNWSYKENNISYLKGSFIINSANYTKDLKYTVLCRFLPIDPSIYCEKSLDLEINSFELKDLSTFFIILIICTILCLVNALLKVKSNKKSEKYIQHSQQISSEPNEFITTTRLEINQSGQDFVEIPIKNDLDMVTESKLNPTFSTSIIQSS